MADYLLPDVGEGLTEAEIVAWRVEVGDVIEINDVVVDIETAKSIVELPSPYAGTVTALLVAEGETVEVGTAIISVGAAPAPADAPAGAPVPEEVAQQPSRGAEPAQELAIDLSNPAASGGGEGESLVGRSKAERGPQRRPRKGSASPSTESAAATQMQLQGAFAPGGAQSDPVVALRDASSLGSSGTGGGPARTGALRDASSLGSSGTAGVPRVLAKPPVRKLAKDLGVDLASLSATGPGGTVTRDDVRAASSRGTAGTSHASVVPTTTTHDVRGAAQRETREPVRGVRKMMGQAMVDSAFTAPHVTEWVTVDVTRTTELVERLEAHRELRGVKVTPLLVLARAALLAMRRTPIVNSTWDDDAQEVVVKHYVNLGIAAATPRGLVVPNVKDAHDLGLRELADALAALTTTAREGRTQPADMAGGTFTITNVGVFGVDAGTPIINPGESAILCFGAIRKQPWVVTHADGTEEIAIRYVTTLALSFDHRHIDGALGSQFLADVGGLLADPASALVF